jgi:hypothetical protein
MAVLLAHDNALSLNLGVFAWARYPSQYLLASPGLVGKLFEFGVSSIQVYVKLHNTLRPKDGSKLPGPSYGDVPTKGGRVSGFRFRIQGF